MLAQARGAGLRGTPMTDDARLQAAVIAGVSALVVSLVGLLTSLIAARSSRRTAQILELAKRAT